MNVKVRVVIDMDNRNIVAIDFSDRTLDSCRLSKLVEDLIYKKAMNTSFKKFRKIKYFGEGKTYYYITVDMEVFPKVSWREKPNCKFRYICTLYMMPVSNSVMSYSEYNRLREAYRLQLSEQIVNLSLSLQE